MSITSANVPSHWLSPDAEWCIMELHVHQRQRGISQILLENVSESCWESNESLFTFYTMYNTNYTKFTNVKGMFTFIDACCVRSRTNLMRALYSDNTTLTHRPPANFHQHHHEGHLWQAHEEGTISGESLWIAVIGWRLQHFWLLQIVRGWITDVWSQHKRAGQDKTFRVQGNFILPSPFYILSFCRREYRGRPLSLSLFVAFYDPQGYCGGILAAPTTGLMSPLKGAMRWKLWVHH